MSDFTKYSEIKESGGTAVDVWRQAEADGLDKIARIRLVRTLFGLTVVANNKPPGWLVLRRGFDQLLAVHRGWHLASENWETTM